MKNWRNRIVGQGEKPASEFLANPFNWRVHVAAQRGALRGVLAEVGWIQQVIENVQTGHVIDGHMRIEEALSNDDAPVPYLLVDLTEDEEKKVLATLDPIAAMAATDAQKLDELLRDVSTADESLMQMLSDLASEAGITPPDFAPVDEAEVPRLNEKTPIECPHCGREFIPNG